jgi:tetratricopeptide (TPR) repeat protein
LSGIYFKKEDYKKALEMADKAIKMDKENAAAYVNRGMAKEMLRDMNGACEDWLKAKELGSEMGKIYYAGNCGN